MMKTNTAIKEIKRRFLDLDDNLAIKDDVFTLSVSSEYPVSREYGQEILLHTKESINLERFSGGKAPVLWNHNPDEMIGTVVRSYLDGKKLKADIQFGSSEKAEQIRKDVEKGIIKNASIGYVIEDLKEDEEGRMVVTKFTPMELSLVSVPADPSVGFRSYQTPKGDKMAEPLKQIPDPENIQAIGNNWEEREYRAAALDFSVIEAAKGIASGRGLTGREAEVNREIEIQTGKRTQGFFVPKTGWSKRAYVAGTASAGGNLIATDLLADNFIEALRNRTVVGELGATYLPGLVGNVAIPRRSGDNTAYWIAGDNGDTITESTGTVDQVTMSPKTVAAYTKFSHLMKLQATPEIEQIIRNGFVAIIANAIDAAALNGSGSSNQPTGILNVSGIGSVAGGTNGAAADLDDFIDLKKEVSVDNADLSSCAYVTNAKVEAAIHKLKDSNGDYILSPYGAEVGSQQILSRKMEVTNNIPSNLSKGSGSNLSAILYGNFSDLYIGLFSELEILVDPYTDFAKGTTGLRAIQSLDINVAHPQSFAAMKDAIAA